jgi:DNA-binding response OmpR family regulator/DNA-binding CsgD family transcriptional regulator
MNIDTDEKDLVLIVDDSPETLSVLNEVLESEGMETLVALEGNQALSIARKMLPDLILLDAIMPALDGFEVCGELKKDPELRSIPVIFMTGLSDTENVVKGFEAGGIDYITKPINNSELIARMRVHLANSRVALSAQSALDMAGQYIFAVDSEGKCIWSTPQVNQLLDAASRQQQWISETLPQQIQQWLERNPSMGMGLGLKAPEKPIKIIFLGKSANNEYLLRLASQDAPDEALILRNNLEVTARESEVLLWIAKGKTNREIGQILGTSPRTINKHSERIYKKLSVENRTAAAAKALDLLSH